MIAIPRIPVDRRRAARALANGAELLLAALPFLLGLLLGLLSRLLVWVWLAVLWVLGVVIAGYDAGRRRRS